MHLRGAEREFQYAAAAEFSGAAAVLRAAAVRPVTPVHGMLKRFASSKLFFMCALLFTVQMVVSAVLSVIEVFMVLQNQAYLLERAPIGTNFIVEFNSKHCARSKHSGAYRALAAVRLREEDGHAVHEHSGRHAV